MQDFCVEVVRIFVLCVFIFFCVVSCILCCIYVCLCYVLCVVCVRSVCVLCAGLCEYSYAAYMCIVLFCAYIYVCLCVCRCVCICVRMYVRTGVGGIRLRSGELNPIPPLYGYLCGYRVRIIKYKKTQP